MVANVDAPWSALKTIHTPSNPEYQSVDRCTELMMPAFASYFSQQQTLAHYIHISFVYACPPLILARSFLTALHNGFMPHTQFVDGANFYDPTDMINSGL